MNTTCLKTAANPQFPLGRDAFGKLIWTTSQNERLVGVVPVRAFPIQSPEVGISLVSPDGHEVACFKVESATG